MAGMEIDSPPQRVVSLSPRDRIVQRLAMLGIPEAYLHQFQLGLVALVRDKKFRINDILSCILPTDLDISDAQILSNNEIVGGSGNFRIKALFDESIWWLQWLMFAGDPHESLSSLLQVAAGQRAVCGAVWGQNDLAYRCRTCEHDPTCAICVSCFQNGNHKDHDYNIMYTGGGCCDCGDETAWRKEGFCSKHKGIEEISPLPQELANSIGPVLDSLLSGWKDRVMAVQHGQGRLADHDETCRKAADGLSAAVIQMLLDFCDCSESLLGFLCRRMTACSGLLDILLKAERLLDKEVVKKLHELLLKLLGDPVFKYDFAKIFIRYYPINMKAMISESSDSVLERYPMLSTFSVQIFTVPTLTVRLVTEVDLLSVLLGCLKDLFLSCVDVDGHIQVRKWENMSKTTIRLIEDVRYVMSHQEVQAYIAHERPEISRAWIFLLKLVQGMDAQIRITGIISEEENENLFIPFFLGHCLGNVNALLVGALSVERYGGSGKMQGADDTDGQRHAKVGRVLQESSASQTSALDALQHMETHDGESCSSLSSSLVWLISECLKAIECWLRTKIELLNHSSYDIASSSGSNILAQRKKLYRAHKGTNTLRVNRTSVIRMDMDAEVSVSVDSNGRFIGADSISATEREATVQNNNLRSTLENNGTCLEHRPLDDSLMEAESSMELAVGSIFSLSYFPNISYDVSSQEISFHIPLHRLLSLLLRKAMKVCFALGQSGKTDCTTSSGVSIKHEEYFRKLLAGMHPYGFSAFIMEHPLQLRVYCAQVRSGMWRKSGDAAILCSEWYRSIQWFEQGLESDLFLLQCCAALAPSDLFVQRVLERFGLSNYLSLNLADYNEFEAVLVLEMLTLIIHIVKERRFCGLTVEENLHRELVYRLAIGDATHSQLVNSLPRDLSKSDKLQNVLDVLAVYCNPSGMKQGKYSLRKAYWKDLDLYHPRWSSKDLQAAEERYFRFCKVSALNAQLPRWTPVIEPLTPVSRIATSNIVLQIVRAVLFYAFFSKSSSISRAPDAVLITALHLVSLALDICEAHQLLHIDDPLPMLIYACEECNVGSTNSAFFWKNQSLLSLLVSLMRKFKEENDMYVETRQCNVCSLIEVLLKRFSKLNTSCMVELQRLAPDVVFDSPQVNRSDQNLASTSDVDDRKAKARQRQAAILEKMRAEQSKFVSSLSYNSIEQETYKQKEPFPDNVKEEAIRICSLCHESDSGNPLCFLILLQKSRLTTFVEQGPPTWQDEVKKSEEIDLAGKEKLIDSSGLETSSQILSVQNTSHGIEYDFEPTDVDAFLNFVKEQIPDIGKVQLPVSSVAEGDASFSLDLMEEHLFRCIIEDMLNRRPYWHNVVSEQNYLTYLAAVDSRKGGDLGFVLGEYASCLTKKSSKQKSSSMYGLFNFGNLSSKPKTVVNKISRFGPKDCDGIHISSCGHAVHQDCHERYLASLKQRNIRRLGFEGGHIIDPDIGELLCPVCRRFANSIIPVVQCTYDESRRHMKLSPSIFEENKALNLPLALTLLQSANEVVGHERFLKKYSGKFRETIEPSLGPILCKLCMLYYGYDFNDLLASGRLSQSLLLWDTLTYSLKTTEIASRGRVRASSSTSTMETLYGELRSSSGFILSLLLHISKNTCSSSLEVLLRFRGIQLMAGSICFGASRSNSSSNSDKRRGPFTLDHVERGESFPDIQFWKRAADPILAHDPFSSLMWVLFCLPTQFMQFEEFFIPLVHLFYAVCVVQSLITCYNKGCFDASNWCDSRINDICKVMGKSSPVKNYFGSNHIDPSCHSKDMIRRLTFPFLRRCALLWKLVQSSTMTTPYDISQVWEGLNPLAKAHILEVEKANNLRIELDGIRELEVLFHISPLEYLLKNEVVHSLVLKWNEHLCDELRAQTCGGMLYFTPAVPFKLMQLPGLYQDLLQRYVKLKCAECESVPEAPALCLLCGKLCSTNSKPCCRASRCLNHANSCGAGIGVFLLVRKTTILLQRSSRQAFWPSPYLDAFGEEDIDMCRGKPLHLNEERYAALTYLVASHGLDQKSEVLRQTTISVNGSD